MKPTPFKSPIYVTRPISPTLSAYQASLKTIWAKHRFTNGGEFSIALERALEKYLDVPRIALASNGTIALSLAARALGFSGEVITTPFTFPATPEILTWSGVTPIFADIDPERLTIAPQAVERAITPRTSAILAVHVFGTPCDVEALQSIAERHGLRLLYDGAHAFGTEINGQSVLGYGDATTLSFHATKLFHTAEGGALATKDTRLAERFELLRNFGIVDEVIVKEPGVNGKMSELQAALGLAVLKKVDSERRQRREIAAVYRERLDALPGVKCVAALPNVVSSDQYFVILVDDVRAPVSRDDLYERLKTFNVFSRRYFYPLCSNLDFYRELPSSRRDNLPVANRIAGQTLCLPFYGALGKNGANKICDVVNHIMHQPELAS